MGASNHMIGDRSSFAELDMCVHGSVKFSDGFVISICGQGTILMVSMTGEHLVITGVYFIPRLRTHIISLVQHG